MSNLAKYVASIPPASEPGRNNALNGVGYRVLERFPTVTEAEFFAVLHSWASACHPAIPRDEAEKTIRSAWTGAHSKGAVGSKVSTKRSHVFGGADALAQPHRTPSAPAPAKPAKAVVYDTSTPEAIPDPIKDPTRLLISTLYTTGEGVRIAQARVGSDGREVPDGSGVCLSREEWLRKLDKVGGDINRILSTSEKTGIFVSLNPMKIGGSKDSDVTSYRFALIEFDDISIEEQWSLYQQSKIPAAAIIKSGGKSLHAWVKIDAKDRREFDDRVRILYEHFESSGHRPDVKNKNPSRFSRLPGCVRGASRQELVAVNAGVASFSEWLAIIQSDGLGKTWTLDEILAFEESNDPNLVLGNRYLCKGGSCLIIGPSGIGKSSLNTQLAILWALGRPAFGITPVRPLKSLIIQAENDKGDLREMIRGVMDSVGVNAFDTLPEYELLAKNLVPHSNDSATGQEFVGIAHRLIDIHKPDLVWIDPVLSFIGADVSKQEVCSQFFRNWLNPISSATGVVWMCVHHTGKPPGQKDRQAWAHTDHSYAGIGSSEMVNWARAVMVLRPINDHQFELKLSKRGKRAGATHPDGQPTSTLYIQHGDGGIHWKQIDPPEDPKKEARDPGKPSKIASIAATNLHGFLSGCSADGEGMNQIAKRLETWLAKERKQDISLRSCKDLVALLVENGKLTKNEDGKYIGGPEK